MGRDMWLQIVLSSVKVVTLIFQVLEGNRQLTLISFSLSIFHITSPFIRGGSACNRSFQLICIIRNNITDFSYRLIREKQILLHEKLLILQYKNGIRQACEMKFQKIEIKRESRNNNIHQSILESISVQIMRTLQCDITHLVLFIDILPKGDRLMLASFYEKEKVYCTTKANIASFCLVIRSEIQRLT